VSNEFLIRSMPIAAYALALGCNFPEVVEENGRQVFAFDDESGEAEAAFNEYRTCQANDPQGVGCQCSAIRLFESWQLLKRALPPREART
jgi:hypothetical protein